MLRRLLLVPVLLMPLTGCESTPSGERTSAGDKEGPYRHVVVFRFKPGVTAAEIDEINRAFEKLPSQIDTIRHFEWGVNVSPEPHADGFTHCYLVTFDNKAGLEAYLPHPAHVAFVELLKPKLDKPFVVDYVPAYMR